MPYHKYMTYEEDMSAAFLERDEDAYLIPIDDWSDLILMIGNLRIRVELLEQQLDQRG